MGGGVCIRGVEVGEFGAVVTLQRVVIVKVVCVVCVRLPPVL